MNIRSELPGDASVIGSVTEAAFAQAAHSSHTEHFIVSALREHDAMAVSMVAEVDGSIIGHVAISPVSIADGSDHWFGLGPVSVLPEHQRQGVGSFLIERALAELRNKGAAGCVVLGEPAYYRRFGFVADLGLVLSGVPPEYFQVLSYVSVIPKGEVTYHRAFEAVC